MKIEVLFPEFCNLFGDAYNMVYLEKTLPEAEFIRTKFRKDRGCGMKEKIQLLAAALALILLLCSCAVRGTASNDAKPSKWNSGGGRCHGQQRRALRGPRFSGFCLQ